MRDGVLDRAVKEVPHAPSAATHMRWRIPRSPLFLHRAFDGLILAGLKQRTYSNPPARNLAYDNVQRFTLAGAAHGPPPGIPKLGSAPVSVKRVELNRSSRRPGYGH